MGSVDQVPGLMFSLPPEFSEREFENLMLDLSKAGVSDITIETGKPVYVRLHSQQLRVTPRALLDSEARRVVTWTYGGNATAELSGGAGLNKRYEVMRENVQHMIERTYFRFNAVACQTVQGRGGISVTYRTIPTALPTLDGSYMRLPSALFDALVDTNDGLMLVVGATGQGKTSLLAAMLHHKFKTMRNRKFVTGEAPVEYNLQPLHAMYPESSNLISQREIGRGQDQESFYAFVKEALRQGPTDILVGESRDEETIRETLHAAETGHATITTVHAEAVDTTLLRIANEFPPHYFSQIVFKLCSQLRLIVVQRLLPGVDPCLPRVPVRSWLYFTNQFRYKLLRMQPMDAIAAIGDAVRAEGQSFAQQAEKVFREGLISEETFNMVSAIEG